MEVKTQRVNHIASLLPLRFSALFPAENIKKQKKQGLAFSKGVWECICAVTTLPVSQLKMAYCSTKYFMTCVIAFAQNANTVEEEGSPVPRVCFVWVWWFFCCLFAWFGVFLQCVQRQKFWFKMEKGFVLEGETAYSRKAQVLQWMECHCPCPIQLSSPST